MLYPQAQTFSASPAELWPWVFNCWLEDLGYFISAAIERMLFMLTTRGLRERANCCIRILGDVWEQKRPLCRLTAAGVWRPSQGACRQGGESWNRARASELIHFRNEELSAHREWDQLLLRTIWLSGSMNTHIRHHRTCKKQDMWFLCCLWNPGSTGTLGDIFSPRPSKETRSACFPQIWWVLGHYNFQIILPSLWMRIYSKAPCFMCPSDIKIVSFKRNIVSCSDFWRKIL